MYLKVAIKKIVLFVFLLFFLFIYFIFAVYFANKCLWSPESLNDFLKFWFLGVSMASLTELSFNWTGFFSAMVANVAFTYRSIYLKQAMVRYFRHRLLSSFCVLYVPFSFYRL